MKIKIRKGVFETNSSSMHSFVVRSRCANDIAPLEDGYVHVEMGQYGWGYDVLTTSHEKLCYLVTMAFVITYDAKTVGDFIHGEKFQYLNDIVKRLYKCKGIWVDEEFRYNETYDELVAQSGAYVDHQSVYDITTTENGLSAEDILLKNIAIIIDNDNH